MRGQTSEDLVELVVGHRSRDPGGDTRPVTPGPITAVRLHRVVMRMSATPTAGPVHREPAQQRPTARVPVDVVESPQHRLAVRPTAETTATSPFSATGALAAW